jgi:N-acyl-D-aspartate/D-glutamate deacylase
VQFDSLPGSLQHMASLLYFLGDTPDYEPAPDQTLAAQAEARGVDAMALCYDTMLERDGQTFLLAPFFGYSYGDHEAIREMMLHPAGVSGLSDGGAHCRMICDASYPTFLLTHWARDRERGTTFELPFLIQRQCRGTAETVGLLDRGLLAPGLKADINMIDFDQLAVGTPTVVDDLPAGGKRLVQGAHGYLHTFVSGIETQSGGEPTDARPGRLVRGARTATATATGTAVAS